MSMKCCASASSCKIATIAELSMTITFPSLHR
jgi:hypothetical protein